MKTGGPVRVRKYCCRYILRKLLCPIIPPPISKSRRGYVGSHFLGKGARFWRLSREEYPEKAQNTGYFL